MERKTTTIEEELSFLERNAISQEEFDAKSRAWHEDIRRIGEFLPKETAQKYLEISDQRLDEEHKDKVLIPEFGKEELEQIQGLPEEARGFFAALGKLAGKTGAELDAMRPTRETDYSKDIERVRWFLANHWLSTLSQCHYYHREDSPDSIFSLRDDLFPEESQEEIAELGGSHMGYLRRDLGTAGIVYEEQQDACYAEFVAAVKRYLVEHPEGLVLRSYEEIRLFGENGHYVVR